MNRITMLVGVAAAAALATGGEASAQTVRPQSLFGSGGSSMSSNEGSLLRGNERFIRGNRRTGNFIGTDARDRRGFVGAQRSGAVQAVAPVAGRIRRAPNVNTTPATAINRATGAYEPRLAIGFEVPAVAEEAVNARVVRHLQAIPGLHPANRIEVSVEDGTATLRGVVVSERDRTLVERLVLFEPGISAVRNDLKVAPELERPAQPAASPARASGSASGP